MFDFFFLWSFSRPFSYKVYNTTIFLRQINFSFLYFILLYCFFLLFFFCFTLMSTSQWDHKTTIFNFLKNYFHSYRTQNECNLSNCNIICAFFIAKNIFFLFHFFRFSWNYLKHFFYTKKTFISFLPKLRSSRDFWSCEKSSHKTWCLPLRVKEPNFKSSAKHHKSSNGIFLTRFI